jgi:hypothetical protein
MSNSIMIHSDNYTPSVTEFSTFASMKIESEDEEVFMAFPNIEGVKKFAKELNKAIKNHEVKQ